MMSLRSKSGLYIQLQILYAINVDCEIILTNLIDHAIWFKRAYVLTLLSLISLLFELILFKDSMLILKTEGCKLQLLNAIPMIMYMINF